MDSFVQNVRNFNGMRWKDWLKTDCEWSRAMDVSKGLASRGTQLICFQKDYFGVTMSSDGKILDKKYY